MPPRTRATPSPTTAETTKKPANPTTTETQFTGVGCASRACPDSRWRPYPRASVVPQCGGGSGDPGMTHHDLIAIEEGKLATSGTFPPSAGLEGPLRRAGSWAGCAGHRKDTNPPVRPASGARASPASLCRWSRCRRDGSPRRVSAQGAALHALSEVASETVQTEQ
jgi:hypothetical protein